MNKKEIKKLLRELWESGEMPLSNSIVDAFLRVPLKDNDPSTVANIRCRYEAKVATYECESPVRSYLDVDGRTPRYFKFCPNCGGRVPRLVR